MNISGYRECQINQDGTLSSPYYSDFVWDQPVVRAEKFDADTRKRHADGLHAFRVQSVDPSRILPRPGVAVLLVQPAPDSRVVLGDLAFRAEALQITKIVVHHADLALVHRYWSRWVEVVAPPNRKAYLAAQLGEQCLWSLVRTIRTSRGRSVTIGYRPDCGMWAVMVPSIERPRVIVHGRSSGFVQVLTFGRDFRVRRKVRAPLLRLIRLALEFDRRKLRGEL